MRRARVLAGSLLMGALVATGLVWATAAEPAGLEPDAEALSVPEPELDSRTGEPIMDDVEAYQPRYIVGGDGRMYENRPAAVYQPVDRIVESSVTARSDEAGGGQVEDQDYFERLANCPDGVPFNFEGDEVCALRCRSDGDCPSPQGCRFDVNTGSNEGVRLP